MTVAARISASAAELDYRPSYLAATAAGFAVFVLYLITLAPTTSMWDTSEYITAAYTLGLPHPPGNPLFVLIGRVFAMLPIAPTVAMRINVLAAISSAVSAGFWFLVTERVLVSWFPQRWQRIAGGALCALIGATAFTVWNQSVVNEKVYTVSLVGLAVICWLSVRWCDDPDSPVGDRLLVLVAYLIGLGYANHIAGVLAAPAVGLAVLIRRPAFVLRWRLLIACGAALFLGLTPFATQPIRAAHFPGINEGEPTACADEIAVSCTFSKLTWDRWYYNFDRGQYGKPDLSERQAPLVAQVQMWWLYFKWQWLRDAYQEHYGLQNALAWLFLILGGLGGWVHFKKDRRSFSFFGPLIFTLTLVLIYYLNFKYGHSQAPDLQDSVAREVRDRDYFYLWSFSALSVWIALGLLYLWETVATVIGSQEVKLGGATVLEPHRKSLAIASPLLLIAFVPMIGNWTQASRSGQTDTADFAKDLLNSVEPYGVLITVGDNDTFPLWYAQEVEGVRKDVLVANTSLMNTDWYTRQMIRRPVYDYDEANGPAAYRGKTWVKPTGPAIKMTYAEADAIPLGMDIAENMAFEKGGIVARPKSRQLMRADYLVYQMLKDSYPERPMYFSRTAGTYPYELGLERYMLTQGMAKKLMDHAIIPSGDTLLLQGEGFVDVARTQELWNNTFLANKSLAKRNGWVDDASVGIPDLYVITGMTLAESLARQGKTAASDSVFLQAKAVATAMRRAALFGLDRLNSMPTAPADTAIAPLLTPAPPAPPAGVPPATVPPVKKP
ncbi:MAG: DUF2723 domain-containing protein [Phycisphaerae bacterium]|nr:DUF2723 domain-containing protein [Gemmatimonadaceae bacterium]